MAKRGRPARKRKGGRSLEEIQAQIDAKEEAAKKRREERKPTGAAADPSKQFKAKQEEEENIPEGLDDLLDSIANESVPNLDELLESVRKEGKKKTTKKTAAVFPSPKPEKKETDSIASENIDPVILRMLGLDPENVVDIDYDTYKRLLREQMAAGRMAGSKLSSQETELVTEEFKRVKNKTGRFKVKGQKVKASSFVAKKRPSGAITVIKGALPGRGGALVKPETKVAEEPAVELATKLSEVNKNVKSAVDSLSKTQKEEKKTKDAERVAADREVKSAKERRAERRGAFSRMSTTLKKAVAPFKDMFSFVGDFIKKVAFGTIVMELIRLLENPIEYFRPIVDWSNGLIQRFNDWSRKFVEDTLRPVNGVIEGFNTKISEVEKTLNGFIDKLPGRLGMGQIDLGRVPAIPTEKLVEKTQIPQIPYPAQKVQGETLSKASGEKASGAVPSSSATEQISKMGFGKEDFAIYRDVVANIESKGKYDIQGGAGGMYAGRYQMGAAARIDAAKYLGEKYQGDTEAARKAFRESPEMQERYFAAYTRANHDYLMGNPTYAQMSEKQKLQVLGYAHNQGMGAAEQWLKRGMTASGADAFGTKGSRYSDEIKAAQQKGKAPVLSQVAVNPQPKQVSDAKPAEISKSPVALSAPPAAPVKRKPKVTVLPSTGAQTDAPVSGAAGNQKSVPTFSATDRTNQSMLVIRSIYNIVG